MSIFYCVWTIFKPVEYNYSKCHLIQDKQNVGTSYHDESNMAAILVAKNTDGRIQLVCK